MHKTSLNKKFFALLLIAALTCGLGFRGLAVRELYAERRLPMLELGMTHAELIKLWGAPEEKIEYETKREELWNYSVGAVRFRAGKVVWWKQGQQVYDAAHRHTTGDERDLIAAAADKQGTGTGTGEDVEVEEILNEIMKEVPAKGSSAAKPKAVDKNANVEMIKGIIK